MLRKHPALSFILTRIPFIDLEFTLLNMIIEIQFLIQITFYRYMNIEKTFVSEMILSFFLNI